MELRDGDLSSGSVKVLVRRHAGSQQQLDNVIVSQLSDADQPDVFILSAVVTDAQSCSVDSNSLLPTRRGIGLRAMFQYVCSPHSGP